MDEASVEPFRRDQRKTFLCRQHVAELNTTCFIPQFFSTVMQDSPEVVAARREWRAKEEKRQVPAKHKLWRVVRNY